MHKWQIAGYNWTFWLGWIWSLYCLALAVWVIMQRRSPVATLAWIMTLTLMPVMGLFIYAYFGPQRIKRQRLRRWHYRAAVMSRSDRNALLSQYKDIHRKDIHPWLRKHVRLVERTSGLPIASAQQARLLTSGGTTLHALLEEITQAKHHIHLEYYIFAPDQTGQQVIQALIERARQGIKVRLLIDAVGSAQLLSRRHRHLLASLRRVGGAYAVFHSARFDHLRPLVNLRTHRKIAIIDGHVGFLGGINITDDENELIHPKHAYRDTHLLLRGGVVRWLQYVFMQDWRYAEGPYIKYEDVLLPELPPGKLPVQIIASGPDSDTEAIHRAMIDALNLASNRVLLATPYFVPTEEALMALTSAALRGVQIKLIVPAQSDSRIVSAATRSYYSELQRAGILIFEYQSRMFHAKTLVVDDFYAMVGSANFDNRSFRLNFEVAAEIMDTEFTRQLAAIFNADLSHCRLVATKRTSPPLQRLFEAVARLASPLL